ncbi:agmatinase [Ideonella sp. 4Y11]|uniref:Agmatinase n=1 Tax=Ideonella aquatica TaxID=2824119 RepID=A0A940YKB6_9BURK|nr:agmatinase [Ideonella aquatica]MBQ0959601.1 agmatinase [Ideonella aquatica]
MNPATPVNDHAIHRPAEPGVDFEAAYAGVPSFMRRRFTRQLDGVDVVVSGVPLDIATTYRTGARLGPRAIRAATVQLNERLHPWGFSPCERLNVIDWGDCVLDMHRPHTVHDAIANHARSILASGAKMLTLGGDHYITYPLLRAHAERLGRPLALVHFDAHCDTWADDEPDSLNHGTMFYKAVKEGLVDPKRSVQVGIRTWNDDFMGIEILGADAVHERGPAAIAQRIVEIVGDAPTYLTFDIDCLDPAFAPGTGTPVSGGLSMAQAQRILRGLQPLDLAGLDVVEVAPAYDHAEITALAAAHVAAEQLCLLAARRPA